MIRDMDDGTGNKETGKPKSKMIEQNCIRKQTHNVMYLFDVDTRIGPICPTQPACTRAV
jgi:hypothetical protein